MYTNGRRYAVMLSDLRMDEDRVVRTFVRRVQAAQLVESKNHQVVQEQGPCGPLYYLERIDNNKGR